jgi:predicted nucleic acid-binding protein
VWEAVVAAHRSAVPVVVSAVTLAELLRGGPRDAAVHIILKRCRVESVTPQIGRAAGELLGRTRRTDTIDAIVAVTAAAVLAPVQILTSDPKDLGALTDGMPGVSVQVV